MPQPSASKANVIKLSERVNHKRLQYLVEHFDSLPVDFARGKSREEQKAFMAAYLQKCKKGTVSVSYKQKGGAGRQIGYPGFQGMERELRHTLAADFYEDIDMVNAHPELLLQKCIKEGIEHGNLLYYVSHREECLKELTDRYRKLSREDAKRYYLKALNGGKADAQNPRLLNFRNEAVAIGEAMILKYPELKTRVRKDKDYNMVGSCLNHMLCDLENEVLMAMLDFMTADHVEVGALVFDGMMLLKSSLTSDIDSLLRRCETYVEQKTGYTIKLVQKPMTEGLTLPDDWEEQITAAEPASSGGKQFTDPAYLAMKQTVEERCFCVDEKFYWFNKATGWVPKSRDAISTILREYQLPSPNEGTMMDFSFFGRWSKDKSRRKFEAVGCFPEPLVYNKSLYYNTWLGLPPASYPQIAPHDQDMEQLEIWWEQYQDLQRALTGDDEAAFQWQMNYDAHLVQFPGKKTEVCVIYYSKEKGVGKGINGQFKARLLGQHYMLTEKPSRDVFDERNAQTANKIMIVIDEGKAKMFNEHLNELKSKITERTQQVKVLGKDVESNVPQYLNFAIFTNRHIAIFEAGERRDQAFNVSARLKGNYDLTDSLGEALKSDKFVRFLYDKLMARDLSKVNLARDRPLGQYQEQLRGMKQTIEGQFMVDWAFDRGHLISEVERVPATPLFDKYIEYISRHREYKAPTQTSFGKNLMELQIDGLTKSKTNGKVSYTMERQKMHKWFVQKMYIEADTEAPQVEKACTPTATEARAAATQALATSFFGMPQKRPRDPSDEEEERQAKQAWPEPDELVEVTA